MIRLKDKLLIYEFDCLFSLLSTDNKILTKIFSKIIIPQLVYDEFKNKMNDDIQVKVQKLLKEKFIILEDFEVESQEFLLYSKLIKGIKCKSRGRLESAAITIAKHNQLTILSNRNNNLDEFDVNSVLITDFIVKEYNENIITIDEAQVLCENLPISCRNLLSASFSQLLLKET